ncbi:MAG: DedA family protein, partial [Proteobacteria bacterium]|nr:DedA family protein [Pseudomonadota bacterium]
MEFLLQFVDWFLHLDVHLNELVITLGPWLYLLLFAIVFCETGLVVTPFLPGDSLLFAVGALAALPTSPLQIVPLFFLLIIAGVLGDATNYTIGKYLGPKVFNRDDSWLLRKDHLKKTQAFYERHGGKTIILARFMPIIRTFAPFVAGIGAMEYRRFAIFNVTGAVLWVGSFLIAGYFLGNIPAVQRNFHIIIVAIIVISVLPGLIEWLRSRRPSKP